MSTDAQNGPPPTPGLPGRLARPGALLGGLLRGTGKALVGLPGRMLRHPRGRMALLAALLLTPIPVYWLWTVLTWPAPPKTTLAAALAALDQGDDPLAAYHAKRLFEAEIYAPWNQGGPAYVLGILAARRGGAAEGAKARDYRRLAVNYLSEARKLGFPAGREAHGLFTLGQTLTALGRYAESIEPLREALAATKAVAESEPSDDREHHDDHAAAAPEHAAANVAHTATKPPSATEIHRLLWTAYQRLPTPRLTDALEHNAQYLADTRLPPEEREAAILQRAGIYFELDQPHACREALARVAGSAGIQRGVLLLEARLLLREARNLRELQVGTGADAQPGDGASTAQKPSPPTAAALEKYHEALNVLETAGRRASLLDEAPLEVRYLLGVCRLEMGDTTAALREFREVARRGAHEPAVAAAELRRAELLLDAGQPTEALLALQGALRLARPADEYDNPWLPRVEFRDRVTALHGHLLGAGELGLAVQLAKLAYPLLSREEQMRLLAETHRACAERLEEQPPAGQSPAAEGRTQAREHHRRAGAAFARLARLEFATPRYPEHLWSAARSYEAAGDMARAEAVLQAYLSHDVSPQERPQALLRLAKIQLTAGRPREAAATLRECRDRFAHDPIIYAARLLAAEAYLQLEDFDAARQALRENLEGDLSPTSSEWRDALFALGRLHSLRQECQETIRTLEEAVARYPQAKQAISSRYLIADAYLRLAKDHQRKARTANEAARRQHEQKRRSELEAGLAQLRQIIESGRALQESAPESLERSTLRSARFAYVSTLLDLERHEEAVRACAELINRYEDTPEVLEAYVRLAGGLRRLNRPDEAQAALAQARIVLDNLPDGASLANTTNRTREEWKTFLQWLAKE